MSGAVHNSLVFAPWPDEIAVLMGNDAGKLMQVVRVVRGPCGEQFGQRDGAERRVESTESKLLRRKAHRSQLIEILRADEGELVEEHGEGLALDSVDVSEAVERIEGARVAVGENYFGARQPVSLFTMDEVTEDIEGAPCAATFVGVGKDLRQTAQQGVKCSRRAVKQGEGIVEIVFHGNPSFAVQRDDCRRAKGAI